MKKITLMLFVAFTTLSVAQESERKTLEDRKHEIKIGGIKLLAGPILEGTYEYIYSKDFTFGSSVLVNLNSGTDYQENFSLTPFARFYFQESKEYGANGFFVEGFAKYASGKNYYSYDAYSYDEMGNYYSNNYDRKFNAASLGLSLGKKWINNSGFVFEILAGAGRTLGHNPAAPDVFFRGDLNIGYRF